MRLARILQPRMDADIRGFKLAFHLYQKLIRLFFFYFDDSVCDQLRYE